jgi:AAA15 family ATPase/GTPase
MNTPKVKDWYLSIVTKLESIMGGKVKLQRNEAFSLVNFQLQVNEEDSLDMYMASSSANQLTTLYLYFKYWVFPVNNLLILDEPEENLHPKLQEEITWLLYRFAAQRGNRVIFTTHSPIVAETVNIIDKFAELSTIENLDFESIAEEKNFPLQRREELLAPEDIGVYFFSGREVVPYEHKEYGVHFSDFKYVEDKQRLLSDKVAELIYKNSKNND